METKICKSMAKTLHKQSTGSKAPHVLFAMEDAPEWIYVALHERLGLQTTHVRSRVPVCNFCLLASVFIH